MFFILQEDACADLVDAGWSILAEAWNRKVSGHTAQMPKHALSTGYEWCTLAYVYVDEVCLEKASGVMVVCCMNFLTG